MTNNNICKKQRKNFENKNSFQNISSMKILQAEKTQN